MGSDSETEKSGHKDKKKAFTLSPIAKPLAGKKLSKRALKLVRRGTATCILTCFCVYILNWLVIMYFYVIG